jgi:hypothetical protein
MTDALSEQLSMAAAQAAAAAPAAAAAASQGVASSGGVDAASATGAQEQLQLHQQWLDSAVQQLAADGVSVGEQAQLLSQLIRQSLLEDGSSGNDDGAELTADSNGGGLLSLHSWLVSCVVEEGASVSACSACGSSRCHSALLGAATVLSAGAVPEVLWEEHAASCACCAQHVAALGRDGAAVAAAVLDVAVAAVLRSLGCEACRSEAVVRWARTGRARLAACQALRRAFLSANALSQLTRGCC